MMLKIVHNPFGTCSSSMSAVADVSQEMLATSDIKELPLFVA